MCLYVYVHDHGSQFAKSMNTYLAISVKPLKMNVLYNPIPLISHEIFIK